jgi:hypothetical protein
MGEYLPPGAKAPPWHSESKGQSIEEIRTIAGRRTWRHMIHATGAELLADFIGGSQTKVSDGDTEAIVVT